MKLEEQFGFKNDDINWEDNNDLTLAEYVAKAIPGQKDKHELFLIIYKLVVNIDDDREGRFDRDSAMTKINQDSDLKKLLSDTDKLKDLNMGEQQMTFDELWNASLSAYEESAKKPDAIPKDQRTTTRYLTKYERARVLGTRALQISLGAPVLVDVAGETDPLQIAMLELKEKKIPIIIRRYLPSGWYEDWSIDDPDLIIS
eukprot:jgi/Bigna1/49105/estExt_Genewise1.C_390095